MVRSILRNRILTKNNKIQLCTTNTPKVIRTIKNCVNACTINKCDSNTKCKRYLHINEF